MAEFNIVLNGKVDAQSVNKSLKEIEKEINPINLKVKTSGTKGTEDISGETSSSKNIDIQFKKATRATEDFNTKLKNLKTTGGLTKDQFNDFSNKLTDLNSQLNANDITIEDFNDGMHSLKNEVSEASTATKAMGQSITDIVKKFTQWYLISGMVTGAINAIKSIVTITLDLDKAFTSIQMVTGYNAEQIKSLKKEYIDLAKTLGVTVDTVTSAADEWLRAGLNVEDTTKALTASIVLSKVAQMESAEATEYLVAIMNGYNLEANQLLSVVDKLSAIDVVAATSSAELAQALSQSAQSAQLAGLSLDKYLAMIATVSETTRQSASTIGNSFRSIFTRLQKVNIGTLESGESISDVDKVLRLYGIDLMGVTNNLEDMGALLDTLGGKWQDLTAAEKSEISTAIAGNYQREKFLVLMENYNRVLELEEESLNSAGAAADKYRSYQESLEAAINRLKDAWIGLVNSLEASGIINIFLTGAEKIIDWVKGFNEWIQSIGWLGDALKILIPIVIGATAAVLAFKGVISGGAAIATGAAMIVAAVGAVASLEKETNAILTGVSASNQAAAETASEYDEALKKLKNTLLSVKDALNDKFEALEESNKALEKEKTLNEKLLAVEKARQALAEAKQKRVRVFRAGIGFTYEEDVSEMQSAQENLQEAVNALSEYQYDLAYERAQEFVKKLTELLSGDDILEGWRELFDNFSDLLDTQFAEYLKKAQEFVEETDWDKLSKDKQKADETEIQRRKENNAKINAEVERLEKEISEIKSGKYHIWSKEYGLELFKGKEGQIKSRQDMIDNLKKQLLDIPENAGGTRNWQGGITTTDEHGWEMKSLPKGTEILSHQNSVRLSSIADNPAKYFSNATRGQTILQFNGPLNFPNVRTAEDANGFISEITNLGISKMPQL